MVRWKMLVAAVALAGCSGAAPTLDELARRGCDEMRGADAAAASEVMGRVGAEAIRNDYPVQELAAVMGRECGPALDRATGG